MCVAGAFQEWKDNGTLQLLAALKFSFIFTAAAYGNGTYFAVNAQYSACDTYSKPEADGKKYMYLARVLTGEYCPGAQGLVVPKPKNAADPTVLFDSVTDNVSKPSLFVIFNDIQAYPEYLITFKK